MSDRLTIDPKTGERFLPTEVIFHIRDCWVNGYGWSPDGRGVYWYDSYELAYGDFPDDNAPVMSFDTFREFEDYRYGPLD